MGVVVVVLFIGISVAFIYRGYGPLANRVNSAAQDYFRQHILTKLRILLSYLQLLAVFSFLLGRNNPLPESFSSFLYILPVLNLDFFRYVVYSCIGVDHHNHLLLYTCVPLVVVALVSLASFFLRKVESIGDKVRSHFISFLLVFSYLLYPGITFVIMGTFSCTSFDDLDQSRVLVV